MPKQAKKETKRVSVFCVEFTWVEKPVPPELGDVRKAVIQRQTNYVTSIKDAIHLIRDWMDPLDDEIVGLSYEEYRKKVSYCPWDSKKSFDKWMKRETKRTRIYKDIERDMSKVGFASIAQIVGGFVEYDVSKCYSDDPSELCHTVRVEHLDFDVEKGASVLTEIAKKMAEKLENDED